MVLLTNGNVLRGTPRIEGDLVILDRGDGSQMRLRRNQVAFSANSLTALYEHRVGQHSFRSAAIFADDVSWCLRNGLVEEAEVELAKLKSMDPTYPAVARLQRQIESLRSPHATTPIESMVETKPEPEVAPKFSSPEGISPAAVALFATRVQPMLINRCGNSGCHRTGSDTQWKLSHLGVDVRVSARMTQNNLAATVAHLNLDDPYSSELLHYLKTPHANGRYDTSGRMAQSAEATLGAWLSQLGRFPQPHTRSDRFTRDNALPVPVAQTGFEQWPQPQPPAPPAVLEEMRAFDHAGTDDVPEGFAVDQDGEWIYDPDGSFRRETNPSQEPAASYEGLVPSGWPAPVIGPTIPSNPAGPVSSIPIPGAMGPPPVPTPQSSSRPMRLPTIENPFSADLFNRQTQLSSAAAVAP